MKALISTAKALSDPNRVRIVAALRAGELCVCELVDALDMTQSTLSTHLRVIREAALVTTRRSGKWTYYALDPRCEPPLARLFEFFNLAGDAALAKDAGRLKRRLALREGGACCVGFGCGGSRKESKRC